MKILRRQLTTLLVTILLLIAPSPSPSRAEKFDHKREAGSHNEAPASRKLRVLFIGNSYTYVNNLPGIVTALAESANESIESEMIAAPGATLKKHWEDGKAIEALKHGHWDYVVLQEQSTLGLVSQGGPPINNPRTFHEYARLFDAEIKSSGARTMFFLTWARQNLPETQSLLTNAYLSIAKELHGIVIPVGIAWQMALKKNPSVALHQKDLSHPTPAGSYLAGCVLYSTLYGKSAAGLTSRIVGNAVDASGRVLDSHDEQGAGSQHKSELVNLSKPDSAFLQQVAWQTVSEENRHRH